MALGEALSENNLCESGRKASIRFIRTAIAETSNLSC